MSNPFTLNADRRELVGKRVKQLRRSGFVPAVIYGPTAEKPIHIQASWQELRPLLLKAGGTSLVDINLGDDTVNVLIRDVQRDPVKNEVLHIDFYAVDLNEPIETNVRIVVQNADALGKKLGIKIFQPMNRIDLLSMPAKIPDQIVIESSVIESAEENEDRYVTVASLPQLEGVTYLAEDDAAVLRLVPLALLTMPEEDEEGEEEGLEGDDMSAEPEVISRGKEEEEEF